MHRVLGWDIGGVNTKAALVVDGRLVAVDVRPFELQRAPGSLASVLQGLASVLLARGDNASGAPHVVSHAVTMTAELSQMFRSKRDGVGFVLDAVAQAFPGDSIGVYATDGQFLSLDQARAAWRQVAAANWAATARLVARHYPDALLIDTGSTTTDVIPIVGGRLVAQGWTDPERLATGELVYTGAVRTPTEALANHVWVKGRRYGVSAEGFALAGDVHVWRGDLRSLDYTAPTPDGRPPERAWCGERLRRVVCADPALADDACVTDIANALAGAQVARVADAIIRVRAAHPSLTTAVVTGVGAFLAEAAAKTAGLRVERLASALGARAAELAPAAAVALLSATPTGGDGSAAPRDLQGDTDRQATVHAGPLGIHSASVDIAVKIGGSLLSHTSYLESVMAMVLDAGQRARIVVVPGGGPFADAVRGVDTTMHLSPAAAHWTAVRGMDQLAEVLVDKFPAATLVTSAEEVAAAMRHHRVAVLAPYRWLRDADPLPHSWDVTSDSIAAWVAGALGAARLVLVKAPGATGALVDAAFARTIPSVVRHAVVTADATARLRDELTRHGGS